MKKYKWIIGIDVSKSKLDVCLIAGLTEGDDKHHFVIENNEKGFKGLFKELKRLSVEREECFWCMEHTGIYTMPLCYWLSEQQMNYCLVPALEIKMSVGVKRGKSDKTDALSIAKFAFLRQDSLHCFKMPEKDLQKLKVLATHREKIVRTIKMFTRSEEMQEFLPKEVSRQIVISSNKTVKHLKCQQKEMENQMQHIIENNPSFKRTIELITSVPGVGNQTAIALVITTKCFTCFDNWRKMACYAGVAPFEYSSGSSIRGKARINPMADKKLKCLLNFAALSAKKHDDELRLYYEKKFNEGKNAMSILNAIRCKVLSRVFAVVKRGTPYVPLAKYAA